MPYPMLFWEAARIGVSNSVVAVTGDSTSWGNSDGPGGTHLRANAFPKLVADALSNGNANTFQGDASAIPLSVAIYDPRITLGSGWSNPATFLGYGGYFFQNTTTTANLNFAPDNSATFDRIRLTYYRNTGFGSFTVAVDGGAALATIDSNGAAAVLTQTINCTLANHTVNIARVAGQCAIVSVELYKSATKETVVINAGIGGTNAAGWVDDSSLLKPFRQLKARAPHLTFWNASLNAAIADADLDTFITGMQGAGSDVVLLTPPPANLDLTANLAAIQSASVRNKVNVVDIYTALGGSFAAANGASLMANSLHPNTAGHVLIGQTISAFLADAALRRGRFSVTW